VEHFTADDSKPSIFLLLLAERTRGELGTPRPNADFKANPTTPSRQAQGQDGSHSFY